MAASNTHITKQMQIEDEILWAFKFKDEQIQKALKEKQELFNEKLELARRTAKVMKDAGIPLEKISKATGLPITEIIKL